MFDIEQYYLFPSICFTKKLLVYIHTKDVCITAAIVITQQMLHIFFHVHICKSNYTEKIFFKANTCPFQLEHDKHAWIRCTAANINMQLITTFPIQTFTMFPWKKKSKREYLIKRLAVFFCGKRFVDWYFLTLMNNIKFQETWSTIHQINNLHVSIRLVTYLYSIRVQIIIKLPI